MTTGKSKGYNEQQFNRQRFDSAPSLIEGSEDPFKDGYRLNLSIVTMIGSIKPLDADFTGEFALAGMQHQLLIGANYLDYFYQQQIHRGQLKRLFLGSLLLSLLSITTQNPKVTRVPISITVSTCRI